MILVMASWDSYVIWSAKLGPTRWQDDIQAVLCIRDIEARASSEIFGKLFSSDVRIPACGIPVENAAQIASSVPWFNAECDLEDYPNGEEIP